MLHHTVRGFENNGSRGRDPSKKAASDVAKFRGKRPAFRRLCRTGSNPSLKWIRQKLATPIRAADTFLPRLSGSSQVHRWCCPT
jgi:hypothetical protein